MVQILIALMVVLLPQVRAPRVAAAQAAACTHYASAGGDGPWCTSGSPCKIASFWALARPGATLCLKDGTYRGADSMISPLPGVAGTTEQPITVRAVNEGQVLLDAQGGGFAVFLGWHNGQPNTRMVIEGINATGGREATYRVAGPNNLLKRVIGYNGTAGQDDANVFRITGAGSVAEDCAGWGMNARKIMDGAQAGNVQGGGYRRCWAEWNAHPQGTSRPNNTYELGYGTTNQVYENVIGTWDRRGEVAEPEGIMHMFAGQSNVMPDIGGSKVLGSIFYIRPGAVFHADAVVAAHSIGGMTMRDVVSLVAPGYHYAPFYFMNYGCSSDRPCANNVCTNCLAVHAGNPAVVENGSGWSMPGFRQGIGLAAATGGQSAFALLPGICKRYVRGELTNLPLWPWPMNERIKAARVRSGFPAVDVTQQMEDLLGPIPASCKSNGGVAIPPIVIPPVVVDPPPAVVPPIVIPPVVIPPVGVELPPVTLPSFNGPMTCTWTTTMTMQCVPSEP